MLYSDLSGNRITYPNFLLRFCLIIFGGLIALASIIYWRSKLLLSQEYVDFPQHKVQHKSLLIAPAAAQTNQRIEKELNNEQN